MKILILQGAFLPVPPMLGGAVEKVWNSMGIEFAARGHEVIHISRRYEQMPEDEKINGVRHIRVAGYKTPSSMIKLKLFDLLYTQRAIRHIPSDTDVIITNTFWAPILLRGQSGKKVYIDVQRVPKGQMKYYKHSGRFRANSKPVEEFIKAELPLKMHEKITMVPNPLPFSTTGEINMENKKNYVLYTGRIHPEKGIDILIKSFNLIRSKWKLQIIGPWSVASGGGGEEYYKYLKGLITNGSIEFIPPVYDANILNAYYESASVFVYPSIAEKGETFGLAPLEAMSFGCVPIVSDLKCFKDFITNQQNGLIFNHKNTEPHLELADKIKLLIENKPLRNRLAIRALNVRDSHSIPSIATQFLADFDNLTLQ